MELYVNDLVSIDAIVEPPEFFWVHALQDFVLKNPNIQGFDKQIEAFLKDDANNYYRNHIVLNEDGSIATSRVVLYMDRVDFEDVRSQIEALENQRAASQLAAMGWVSTSRFLTPGDRRRCTFQPNTA